MAYDFTDGMDSFAVNADISSKYNTVQSGTFLQILTTGGRFGGGCLRGISTTNWLISKIVNFHGTAATSDEFYMGWSVKMAGYPDSINVMAAFLNEASTITSNWASSQADTNLNLRVTSAGLLAIYRGTTLLATGTTVVSLNSWHRIEVRIVVANSGIFEVHLDGVAEITFAGDTYDTGDAGIRQFAFYGIQASSNMDLDDIIVWNSTSRSTEATGWIGDIKIETLRPTANSTPINSTPLSGAAWDAVNDTAPDGDTTYTQAGTAGNTDLYVMSDLSSTPDTIYAVIAGAFVKSTGTTPRKIKLLAKHTNQTDGDAKVVPLGAYGLVQECFSYDPADFGDWTGADVNAMLIGWSVDT